MDRERQQKKVRIVESECLFEIDMVEFYIYLW